MHASLLSSVLAPVALCFQFTALSSHHHSVEPLYAAPKRLEENVEGLLYVNDRVSKTIFTTAISENDEDNLYLIPSSASIAQLAQTLHHLYSSVTTMSKSMLCITNHPSQTFMI